MIEVSYWLEIKRKQEREDGDMLPEKILKRGDIQIRKLDE